MSNYIIFTNSGCMLESLESNSRRICILFDNKIKNFIIKL